VLVLPATFFIVAQTVSAKASPTAAHVAQLQRHFSVFAHAGDGARRSHASEVPAMPASLYAELASPTPGSPLAETAPEPALATYLGSIDGIYPVWAVPAANTVICLEVAFEEAGPLGGSTGNCGPASGYKEAGDGVVFDVRATEISDGSDGLRKGAPTGYVVMYYGLVPNDTTSVELTSATGQTKTTSVTNNFWAITGMTGQSATFTSSSGATQTVKVASTTIPPGRAAPDS
jgi:hypothetical protein